ncbi:MAG: hypothetical protein KJ574_00890, partial [Nanoarchaeota archaeon]|nr:hypothetical protein [Nanoarchaeota archaeon]
MPTAKLFSTRVKDFNLHHTLECGQFFRYQKESKGYHVQSRDKIFYVEQKNNTLRIKGDVSKQFISDFFRLDENFEKVKKRICVDKHVADAMKKYHGLRLIRQDPWECIISYVCSSASNIPKIKKNIDLLSKEHGKEVKLERFISHAFPEPKTLTSLERINACKVGYRDRFIFEINKKVNDRFIAELRKMDYEDAKKALKSLP